MWVKEDRESEGLAVIAGIGVEEKERASFPFTTLLHPKGSRLLSGALSRETCINFSHEKAKDMVPSNMTGYTSTILDTWP